MWTPSRAVRPAKRLVPLRPDPATSSISLRPGRAALSAPMGELCHTRLARGGECAGLADGPASLAFRPVRSREGVGVSAGAELLPERAVLVHIGPYKTGTTAIQSS